MDLTPQEARIIQQYRKTPKGSLLLVRTIGLGAGPDAGEMTQTQEVPRCAITSLDVDFYEIAKKVRGLKGDQSALFIFEYSPPGVVETWSSSS